jgi:hypothetical protein
LQARWKTVRPQSCSRCSLRRTPCRLFRRMLASVALRTSSGSRRRSAPGDRRRTGRPAARSAVGGVRGTPIPPARRSHHLAVDQARPHREMVHGLDHEREADRPVVASARDQPDADGVAPGHEPVAVVLDLVNPVEAGRRAVGGGRQTRFNETGRHRGGLYSRCPRPKRIGQNWPAGSKSRGTRGASTTGVRGGKTGASGRRGRPDPEESGRPPGRPRV